MDVAGWVAIALGVLLSAHVLQNDFRAARATEAHAGRKFGPEPHLAAGLLSGIGSGLLLGLWPGLGIGAGHAVAGFVLGVIVYRA